MAMRSRTRTAAPGLAVLVVAALALAQSPAQADSPAPVLNKAEQPVRNGSASQARNGDIYGYQLMTERERSEFRERLRAAGSEQEVEQIRHEHHAQMQVRAKERGVTLAGPKVNGRSGQSARSDDANKSAK